MGAGKYRDRITVQEISGSADEYGQIDLDDDNNWSTFISPWAHIAARGGREFHRGEQIQEEISHQITIRSDSTAQTITSKMRVKLGTKTLQIISVSEVDNKNRELVLNCKES